MKTSGKILIASLFAFNMSAHAASFDCSSKQLTKAEKHICNSPKLSKLDDKLAVAYKHAMSVASDKAALKSFAKNHAKNSKGSASTDTKYLTQWYNDRIHDYSNWGSETTKHKHTSHKHTSSCH